MPSHQVDLTSPPVDLNAVPGYETILAAWQKMHDALDKGKSLTEAEVAAVVSETRLAMTSRELAFLQELLNSTSSLSADARHAKLSGGLYKMLMDRQGFKVKKENGGLG